MGLERYGFTSQLTDEEVQKGALGLIEQLSDAATNIPDGNEFKQGDTEWHIESTPGKLLISAKTENRGASERDTAIIATATPQSKAGRPSVIYIGERWTASSSVTAEPVPNTQIAINKAASLLDRLQRD